MLTVAPECWLDELIGQKLLSGCGLRKSDYRIEKAQNFSDSISKLYAPRHTPIISIVDAVRDKKQTRKNPVYQSLSLYGQQGQDTLIKQFNGRKAYLFEFTLTAEDWLRRYVPASFFTKHKVDRNLEARTKSISVRNYTELHNLLDDFLRNEPKGQELVSLFRSLLPA
ncbi:MAG: hypothetical protein SFY70_07460 [Bacteroidia bacterium]|nr:hypothetical protein [Bacteroidia bacterium]